VTARAGVVGLPGVVPGRSAGRSRAVPGIEGLGILAAVCAAPSGLGSRWGLTSQDVALGLRIRAFQAREDHRCDAYLNAIGGRARNSQRPKGLFSLRLRAAKGY